MDKTPKPTPLSLVKGVERAVAKSLPELTPLLVKAVCEAVMDKLVTFINCQRESLTSQVKKKGQEPILHGTTLFDYPVLNFPKKTPTLDVFLW